MFDPFLLHGYLECSAKRFPNKDALVCGNKRLTYRELNERATRLAHGMLQLGLKRHDRVVIFLGNSEESVISLFATLKSGGVFVMLYHGIKANKLAHILTN